MKETPNGWSARFILNWLNESFALIRRVIVGLSALTLVQGTRKAGGKSTPSEKQQKDVTILDVFENAARVMRDEG